MCRETASSGASMVCCTCRMDENLSSKRPAGGPSTNGIAAHHRRKAALIALTPMPGVLPNAAFVEHAEPTEKAQT